MLELILPQLRAIDLIADRYQFNDQDRIQLHEIAISSLQAAAKTTNEFIALYKILLDYVRAVKEVAVVPERVVLLYQLGLELFGVMQYNRLVELKVYEVLKKSSEPMYELVEIFAHKGLPEFDAWAKKSSAFIEERKMSKEQLRKKLGMLLLCELRFEEKITYKDVARAIDVTQKLTTRTRVQT
eukprot:TRINITY_DN13867_c0_g4_i1.p1 TRINITY_DN13867_c0_g4~~TRINITY_DN13867_c0_g4_i1.p1  ORF type:complete len:184 (-),score=80.91 TRINITY_DN13867_c0_g4_i1:205-756(-)